jgi:hypothetical protein
LRPAQGGIIIRAMAEEPIAFLRAVARPAARSASGGGQTGSERAVRFDRRELNRILSIYGRMVAAGEWRDYAIDFLHDRAAFSIFRRSSEMPLYTVLKQPKMRTRQGEYAVVAAGGQVLKRGHDLANVLHILERKLIKVLAGQEA